MKYRQPVLRLPLGRRRGSFRSETLLRIPTAALACYTPQARGTHMSAAELQAHYSSGNLLEIIEAGLNRAGRDRTNVRAADLGPVEEFHIGGRIATQHLFDAISVHKGQHCLDVGCGIGGAARLAASVLGVKVTGVDLVEEFVAVGNTLSKWVGLHTQVQLQARDVAELALDNVSFDAAWMLHVGMNIAEKRSLFDAVSAALQAGGAFAVYDIMRVGDGELDYPMPWASDAQQSFLESPTQYRAYLESAGFEIVGEESRAEFALSFFAELRAKAADGPPPLGLHLLMGEATPTKIKHLTEAISTGVLAPVQIIARKA